MVNILLKFNIQSSGGKANPKKKLHNLPFFLKTQVTYQFNDAWYIWIDRIKIVVKILNQISLFVIKVRKKMLSFFKILKSKFEYVTRTYRVISGDVETMQKKI